MRPLELNPETTRLLDRIRRRNVILPVHGFRQNAVWPLARQAIKPLLDDAGPTEPSRNYYQVFARELIRHCRTSRGEQLALGIELTLRKWRDFKLDLGLLQRLALACYEAFTAFDPGLQPETARQPDRKRKRKPKRTYPQSVEDGDVPTSTKELKKRQFRSYEKAMEHNREISHKVRQVLIEREMPLRQFIRYNAFAYRLDHAARNYTLKTLQTAAENLVDQWEAKGLNRPTLLAICREVFNIPTSF